MAVNNPKYYNNNFFHESKPPASTGIRKDNVFVSFDVVVPTNTYAFSNKSDFSVVLLFHVTYIDQSNFPIFYD